MLHCSQYHIVHSQIVRDFRLLSLRLFAVSYCPVLDCSEFQIAQSQIICSLILPSLRQVTVSACPFLNYSQSQIVQSQTVRSFILYVVSQIPSQIIRDFCLRNLIISAVSHGPRCHITYSLRPSLASEYRLYQIVSTLELSSGTTDCILSPGGSILITDALRRSCCH